MKMMIGGNHGNICAVCGSQNGTDDIISGKNLYIDKVRKAACCYLAV